MKQYLEDKKIVILDSAREPVDYTLGKKKGSKTMPLKNLSLAQT
jgi:hypothetical protein